MSEDKELFKAVLDAIFNVNEVRRVEPNDAIDACVNVIGLLVASAPQSINAKVLSRQIGDALRQRIAVTKNGIDSGEFQPLRAVMKQ